MSSQAEELYFGEKTINLVPDIKGRLYPLDIYLKQNWKKAKNELEHPIALAVSADMRKFRRKRKAQAHLKPYLLTTSAEIKPYDFLFLATYFCRLLSKDYIVLTESKLPREALRFINNYFLYPLSFSDPDFATLCFAEEIGCLIDFTDKSLRRSSIQEKKKYFGFFPVVFESDFICSEGFYCGGFLFFGKYWLKYRRWPGVLTGLFNYLTLTNRVGSWHEKPLGIKVYKRAEKEFPDVTQEVNYYRRQKSIAEFRYSTPINRLQVWIDGENITEEDLKRCVDETLAWAESV